MTDDFPYVYPLDIIPMRDCLWMSNLVMRQTFVSSRQYHWIIPSHDRQWDTFCICDLLEVSNPVACQQDQQLNKGGLQPAATSHHLLIVSLSHSKRAARNGWKGLEMTAPTVTPLAMQLLKTVINFLRWSYYQRYLCPPVDSRNSRI